MRLIVRPQFNQPIARPKPLGPEFNAWYWNPNRPPAGPYRPSKEFLTALRQLDGGEDLEAVWNPIQERWQLWAKAGHVSHPMCQGWRLLFIHNGAGGEYLPLNETALARLYWSSAAAFGSAKKYFDAIQREAEREKEAREKKNLQDQIDMAMPYFEHSQIKNIGKGSKFTNYLS